MSKIEITRSYRPCEVGSFEEIERGHFFLDEDGDLCLKVDEDELYCFANTQTGSKGLYGAEEMHQEYLNHCCPVNVSIKFTEVQA